MQSTITRRTFLAASGASLAVSLAGCQGDEREDEGDHTCRETWNIVLYNKSDTQRSAEVTILDNEDSVVFSGTVELDANTDRSTGVELDEEVYYDRSYSFEAELSDGNAVSTETVLKCGNVYIRVTESGELEIQDDEIDHV